MTTESSRNEKQKWIQVKAKIIARFGTVAAFAARLGCSVNSVRGAVSGKCPAVAARMKQEIPKVFA